MSTASVTVTFTPPSEGHAADVAAIAHHGLPPEVSLLAAAPSAAVSVASPDVMPPAVGEEAAEQPPPPPQSVGLQG